MTVPGARRQPRSLIQMLVVGLLFVAVAVTLARGWSELASYQWRLNQAAAGVALVLWLATNLGAGACWITVTRAFGVRLPIGLALRVFCTSNLGKYLPGKVLHVFARIYLVQQQGVSVGVGTTSAMLDVLLYIGAGLVFSVFALPMALSTRGGDPTGTLLFGAGAIVLGVALLHPRVLNAVLAIGGRFVPRFRNLRFELSYRTILGAFILYLLLWLIVAAAVYAGVSCVASVPLEDAPILGAIFALSYVTGLITPTPAGVGGREAVMIALFPFFMPAPAAVVATILNRLLQVGAEALCAGLLSVAVRRRDP
jgi:uncharacterized membrane protein YbhN (UPF0104 family)